METDERIYTVIIGDISGSKQLSGEHRYQTQLFIKSAIVQINEQFHSVIEAPLTITKGDEFQGLLPDLADAFQIILSLERLTFPIQMRFGIGEGRVLRMGGRLPIEMDGPAFHRANTALQCAKKKKMNWCLNSGNDETDNLINVIFKLMTAIKSRWSERHYRLYWNYKDLGTYKEVATLEKVTPQAICDMLKNIRALDVKCAEETLMKFFTEHHLSPYRPSVPSPESEVEKLR